MSSRKPFKPHRPSNSTAATRTPTTQQNSTLRRTSNNNEDEFSDSLDEEPEVTTQPETQTAAEVLRDEPPTIPPKFLRRLLQHHCSHSDTKVSNEASELTARYMEIFIREAMARAVAEKEEEANKVGGGGGGVGADFLEVEDLERMAPQLILDF